VLPEVSEGRPDFLERRNSLEELAQKPLRLDDEELLDEKEALVNEVSIARVGFGLEQFLENLCGFGLSEPLKDEQRQGPVLLVDPVVRPVLVAGQPLVLQNLLPPNLRNAGFVLRASQTLLAPGNAFKLLSDCHLPHSLKALPHSPRNPFVERAVSLPAALCYLVCSRLFHFSHVCLQRLVLTPPDARF